MRGMRQRSAYTHAATSRRPTMRADTGIVTGTRMAAMTLIDSAATCSRCVRTRQVGTLLWPLELPSAV